MSMARDDSYLSFHEGTGHRMQSCIHVADNQNFDLGPGWGVVSKLVPREEP